MLSLYFFFLVGAQLVFVLVNARDLPLFHMVKIRGIHSNEQIWNFVCLFDLRNLQISKDFHLTSLKKNHKNYKRKMKIFNP